MITAGSKRQSKGQMTEECFDFTSAQSRECLLLLVMQPDFWKFEAMTAWVIVAQI